MHVIARPRLIEFCKRHPDSRSSVESWFHEAKKANWGNTHEIKKQYGSASILGNDRVVFNICGNKYGLIVKINFGSRIVCIRFIGTHGEYEAINAHTI
jgi:mRNA interferase HigB